MIDLTGKRCAHPVCEREATVAVWGEGPRKDTGEMMRVEFGVCEEHEGATCGNDECANFPSAYIKDEGDPPNYLFLCEACIRASRETPVIAIDGQSMMVKIEGEQVSLVPLPEPRQG